MEVTDTAAMIARVRAEEARHPPGERLFDDPFAVLFVPDGPISEIEAQLRTFPSWIESVRLRTRYIDDVIRASLAAGHRQLVLLGVGFDCRALRLHEIAATGTTVFEVDFPQQLEQKWSILRAAGVTEPAWNRQLACDFSGDDFESSLSRALLARGFRRGAGTLFVWEGVIGYLDDAAVERTLRLVTGLADAWFVFNYQIHRSSPERIRALLTASGFREIEDETIGPMYRRLVGSEPSPGHELFHLVRARL